jgi:hypothetical protein
MTPLCFTVPPIYCILRSRVKDDSAMTALCTDNYSAHLLFIAAACLGAHALHFVVMARAMVSPKNSAQPETHDFIND